MSPWGQNSLREWGDAVPLTRGHTGVVAQMIQPSIGYLVSSSAARRSVDRSEVWTSLNKNIFSAGTIIRLRNCLGRPRSVIQPAEMVTAGKAVQLLYLAIMRLELRYIASSSWVLA